MIAIIVFIGIFISGFIFSASLSKKLPLFQKIGLAFPLGFGIYTLLMLIFNILHIKFNITLLSISTLIISVLLLFFVIKIDGIKGIVKIDKDKLPPFKQINFSWIVLFAILVYIVYGITMKSIFWPPAAYDTVTGYDYMAKVVASEGCFNNSIFNIVNPTASIRHSYPPYVSGSYAIPYMLGLNSSKISLVLISLSFLILIWSVIKEHSNQTLTMFFVVVLFTTPEFLAMTALSLTNFPQTIFASIGLIYLFQYMENNDKSKFWLSAVLLGFNIYTRVDGVVFILGGGAMLLFNMLKNKQLTMPKKYISLTIYAGITLLPIVFWSVFKAINIDAVYDSSNAFRKELFFDGEKLSVLTALVWKVLTSKQYYGYIMIFFIIALVLNARNIHKDKTALLIGLFTAFLIYFVLYYQMDNDGAKFNYSISGMVNSSFKRGMFPFLPIMCYYMATSKALNNVFNKLLTIGSKN